MVAIPDALLQLGRDECSRLGLVELEPAREPFLGEKAGLCGVSPTEADVRVSDQT